MANLCSHDILNMKSDYGKRLASYIESEYNIKVLDYSPVPQISFTSRKAILKTNKGDLFLKEKPYYCKSANSLFRSFTFKIFVLVDLPTLFQY